MAERKIEYLVRMAGREGFFAVLKNADFNAAYFHGTGVWVKDDPRGKETELDTASMSDEYIPWHRINCITNCMYKPR
jgi:hypothetical protein